MLPATSLTDNSSICGTATAADSMETSASAGSAQLEGGDCGVAASLLVLHQLWAPKGRDFGREAQSNRALPQLRAVQSLPASRAAHWLAEGCRLPL